jgi:NADPH:quinone reductase-like Zn-dependent oxidoreductase
MRAVVHERYGPPDVLRVAEVERPVPKEDEVLVKVHASTVTRGDTELRSVEYPFARLITGIRRPKRTIAGIEFAGRVEDVGAAVTEFRVGDEVFGIEGGANAEYVTARESGVIAQKPTGLTYEEAAPSPTARCSRLPACNRRIRCGGRASSSTAPRAPSERAPSSYSHTTSRPR